MISDDVWCLFLLVSEKINQKNKHLTGIWKKSCITILKLSKCLSCISKKLKKLKLTNILLHWSCSEHCLILQANCIRSMNDISSLNKLHI